MKTLYVGINFRVQVKHTHCSNTQSTNKNIHKRSSIVMKPLTFHECHIYIPIIYERHIWWSVLNHYHFQLKPITRNIFQTPQVPLYIKYISAIFLSSLLEHTLSQPIQWRKEGYVHVNCTHCIVHPKFNTYLHSNSCNALWNFGKPFGVIRQSV